jgi:molybdopterin converting factor small subunit
VNNLKVKVKFYGYYRDLFGDEAYIELDDGSVEELSKIIKEKSGVEPIILVNGTIKRSGKLVGEVEALPPASGG